MSAAVIADNTTIKIAGGAGFVKTTAGATTIFTTTSKQTAKLRVRATFQGQTAGSAGTCKLTIGGAIMQEVIGNTGTAFFFLGGTKDQFMDFEVPPSSSVVIQNTVNAGTVIFDVAGLYTLLENSP